MARAAGVRVEGLREVVRDLEALGADVDDLKDAFGAIAAEGAARAARHAPKRTGRLATSIRGSRAKSKAVVTAGRAAVPYAGPINYGWPAHGITGSGFMQKASDEMEPRAAQLLEAEINRRIRSRGL